MPKYIEQEAALSAVDCGNLHKGIVDALQENIKDIPAADVEEVRHGRWVKSGQSFVYPHKFRNYSCSVCGYDIEKTKYNYCPNCGAKMDGGVNDAVD